MTADTRETAFDTSGHKGTTVRWWRTEHQLVDEVELVKYLLESPVDLIVNFAPTAHLFGALFGNVLPKEWDIPVIQAHEAGADRLPTLPGGAHVLLVCLPSSWPRLARGSSAFAASRAVSAIHGAGPTVPDTRRAALALHQVTEFRGVELFGSTETGAIAHRPIEGDSDHDGLWALLSDVELASPKKGEGRLAVRSPRIARADGCAYAGETVELDDLVIREGDRSFVYLGRDSRLVKVNGARMWLDELERTLRSALPGLDIACVRCDDQLRGEHFAVYYAAHGHQDVTADKIRRAVWERDVEPPPPGQIYAVTRIPRTPTGKIRLTTLLELADTDRPEDEHGRVR